MSVRAHRRPILAVTSLLGGVALCAACGTAYSQADVLSDGGSDAQAADGGDGPASEASANDAAGDGPPLDASTLSMCEVLRGDSSADDFFCSDFESAVLMDNVPSGWTDVSDLDAGTVGLLDEAGVGPSRGLDITANTGNTSVTANTRLRVRLKAVNEANQYLHYEVSFDFRVLASNLDYAAFGLLVFAPFTVAGENGLACYGPGSPAVLSHEAAGTSPTKKLANDSAWHHARIALDRDASTASYVRTITIDTVDVDDNPTGHTINAGAPTELWIGLFNADTNNGRAHAQFDNVVLRRRLL